MCFFSSLWHVNSKKMTAGIICKDPVIYDLRHLHSNGFRTGQASRFDSGDSSDSLELGLWLGLGWVTCGSIFFWCTPHLYEILFVSLREICTLKGFTRSRVSLRPERLFRVTSDRVCVECRVVVFFIRLLHIRFFVGVFALWRVSHASRFNSGNFTESLALRLRFSAGNWHCYGFHTQNASHRFARATRPSH